MKKKSKDPLIQEIQHSLNFGDFISYGRAWDFINDLERVKEEIDKLEKSDASRAASLYEVFLAGSYEKAEEIDDSGGDLGMFFEDLFCSWIKARQDSGINPTEIVADILKWIDHDDYGFCYEIENKVARILKKEGFKLFKEHFVKQFEEAYKPFESKKPKYIFDYPREIWDNANVLKSIFIEKKDVKSYIT